MNPLESELMPWPPPLLPINKTNETAQLDDHPDNHNNANQAINDIVTEVKDVYDRRWAAHYGGYWTVWRNVMIEVGSSAVTTDVNGWAAIGWANGKPEGSMVVACNGDPSMNYVIMTHHIEAGQFYIRATTETGGPAGNTAVRVNWISVGLFTP